MHGAPDFDTSRMAGLLQGAVRNLSNGDDPADVARCLSIILVGDAYRSPIFDALRRDVRLWEARARSLAVVV